MLPTAARFTPPFCPNPRCNFHQSARGWRFKRHGFYRRQTAPTRIPRYRCSSCGRSFSSQTFATTYWLKRPDLLPELFGRLVGCAAYRQIARAHGVSPTTVLRQTERLGRHCLLFHERKRPGTAPIEPVVIDGFETFELSQYTPVHFNLAVGSSSHFVYAFTDSELRRKGRMSDRQRRRRVELEARHGCPDPRSIEHEMAALVALVVPPGGEAELRSDDHPAYPRALKRLGDRVLRHVVTPGRAARTPHNSLFPVNLVDLLLRHSSANHKRETISFSKRRQSAAERLAIFLVWRNYQKSFSERRRDATPAMRLGLASRRLATEEILRRRIFPSRVVLPERLARYYWRKVVTRRIPNGRMHALRFAT